MVRTRQSVSVAASNEREPSPDLADNPRLKNAIKKMKTDALPGLTGGAVEKVEAAETYHWRGSSYAVTKDTPLEWINQEPARHKKRKSVAPENKTEEDSEPVKKAARTTRATKKRTRTPEPLETRKSVAPENETEDDLEPVKKAARTTRTTKKRARTPEPLETIKEEHEQPPAKRPRRGSDNYNINYSRPRDISDFTPGRKKAKALTQPARPKPTHNPKPARKPAEPVPKSRFDPSRDYTVHGGRQEKSCAEYARERAEMMGYAVKPITRARVWRHKPFTASLANDILKLSNINNRIDELEAELKKIKKQPVMDRLVRWAHYEQGKAARSVDKDDEVDDLARSKKNKVDTSSIREGMDMPGEVDALSRPKKNKVNTTVIPEGTEMADEDDILARPKKNKVHTIEIREGMDTADEDDALARTKKIKVNTAIQEPTPSLRTSSMPPPSQDDPKSSDEEHHPKALLHRHDSGASLVSSPPQRHRLTLEEWDAEVAGHLARHFPPPKLDLPATNRGGQPLKWSLPEQLNNEDRAEHALTKARLPGESKHARRRRVKREMQLVRSWEEARKSQERSLSEGEEGESGHASEEEVVEAIVGKEKKKENPAIEHTNTTTTPPPPPRQDSLDVARSNGSPSSKDSGSRERRSSRVEKHRKVVCPSFLRGECKRGERCSFQHGG